MAKGRFSYSGAAISTNTTTTLNTPDASDSIYLLKVSIDVTVAGTDSSIAIKDSSTGNVICAFPTTAIGHQSQDFSLNFRDYPGFKLTEGNPLVAVTTGTGAATLTISAVLEVK